MVTENPLACNNLPSEAEIITLAQRRRNPTGNEDIFS
jgi:hypothetical protein